MSPSRLRAPDAIGRRTLGSPVLFAVVYAALAAGLYFSLGVVANNALGLTPVIFLLAALLFGLAAMTYVEGASLHQDRAGATVFARYAFNELWSFIAGWALLLDYVILIAVTTFSATNYLAAYWHELGDGALSLVLGLSFIAYVAVRNVLGFSRGRARRVAALVIADFALQFVLIVAGLFLFFSWDKITGPIDLGTTPSWSGIVFATGLATVVFTGLESASGLSGEVAVGRRGLRRLIFSAGAAVMVVYVGVAVVAVTALPVTGGTAAIGGHWLEAPMLNVAAAFDTRWGSGSVVEYVVAAAAAATLIAGANSAMLGLSRLAYSLATNRQIPSALGRLHPTRSTPIVVIVLAAGIAGALEATEDADFLVGIFAFGALLGLTIAHLSIIVLRYREPARDRPYRIPLSIRVGRGDLPIPAVLGALFSAAAWIGVMVTHKGARYVGLGWMAGGLLLYVIYRMTQGKSLTQRVTVPANALRREAVEAEYGSILVPIFGTPLDDDIVQTAGRLAAEEVEDSDEEGEGATIEALWIFEVPMALPIDARLPEAQLETARAALRRAKAVGEEYGGVEVATATVRARRAGHAIVEEARRRGVELIVLAADEPSRIRGGAMLGGRAGLDNFVGEATKYVVNKAHCRVILTAPASSDPERPPS
ncbi:MAG: amino acid permease [Solirubrobacterales bacterium]|nr:amino acid permease [Solirubrobacterales bacterium]